ncbi:unnamed protein product [Cylindrotheca closterium]|uniref:Uncharacterized protein n=1 Tax=Cylindrotheca closterium TaxID=2856 RepID=A0AAD2FHQ2_9STRA|nr:unnamed protein product [Cylindrotheca closterium]
MKKLEAREADVEHLTGMLSQDPKPTDKDQPEKPPKRTREIVGQHAATIAQTKDGTQRRSVSKLFKMNQRCNVQGEYGNKTLNEAWPKFLSVTFFKDKVVEWPGHFGNVSSCREDPLVTCLGLHNRDQLCNFVEYLCKRLEDIQFVSDKHDLDNMVFGNRGRAVSQKKLLNMVNYVQKCRENQDTCGGLKTIDRRNSPLLLEEAKRPLRGEVDDPLLDD